MFSLYQTNAAERREGVGQRAEAFYINQIREWAGWPLRLRAAKEGRRLAYDLTGLNGGTFQSYARKLGIALP